MGTRLLTTPPACLSYAGPNRVRFEGLISGRKRPPLGSYFAPDCTSVWSATPHPPLRGTFSPRRGEKELGFESPRPAKRGEAHSRLM